MSSDLSAYAVSAGNNLAAIVRKTSGDGKHRTTVARISILLDFGARRELPGSSCELPSEN